MAQLGGQVRLGDPVEQWLDSLLYLDVPAPPADPEAYGVFAKHSSFLNLLFSFHPLESWQEWAFIFRQWVLLKSGTL